MVLDPDSTLGNALYILSSFACPWFVGDCDYDCDCLRDADCVNCDCSLTLSVSSSIACPCCVLFVSLLSRLASMLRGRTYLYVQVWSMSMCQVFDRRHHIECVPPLSPTWTRVQECKIKGNFGFGISFEVTEAFQPLRVESIASMMDVSITVRETHFTENLMGNMGKIPAQWTQHNVILSQQLFNHIHRINPALLTSLVAATSLLPPSLSLSLSVHLDCLR